MNGISNLFCKRLQSKYFRLCRPKVKPDILHRYTCQKRNKFPSIFVDEIQNRRIIIDPLWYICPSYKMKNFGGGNTTFNWDSKLGILSPEHAILFEHIPHLLGIVRSLLDSSWYLSFSTSLNCRPIISNWRTRWKLLKF